MKCALCRRTGTSTSLKKIANARWRCKDAGGCIARGRAQWKTRNKRALWKKRSSPK